MSVVAIVVVEGRLLLEVGRHYLLSRLVLWLDVHGLRVHLLEDLGVDDVVAGAVDDLEAESGALCEEEEVVVDLGFGGHDVLEALAQVGVDLLALVDVDLLLSEEVQHHVRELLQTRDVQRLRGPDH